MAVKLEWEGVQLSLLPVSHLWKEGIHAVRGHEVAEDDFASPEGSRAEETLVRQLGDARQVEPRALGTPAGNSVYRMLETPYRCLRQAEGW